MAFTGYATIAVGRRTRLHEEQTGTSGHVRSGWDEASGDERRAWSLHGLGTLFVAAGPVLVPFCWGWGAPELSYCFGVCCCADATPALTSNAMLANTTKCFLMIRSSFFRCCRIYRS